MRLVTVLPGAPQTVENAEPIKVVENRSDKAAAIVEGVLIGPGGVWSGGTTRAVVVSALDEPVTVGVRNSWGS